MATIRALLCLAAKAAADDGLLNLIFMADIGHPREHKDQLTTPWPMNKAAFEGSFSLYEGLYDYITRQGAKPTAAVIMGDVAYGGGEVAVNNATRQAMQKYMAGVVPEDRVFVTIGNHDVHFLGCAAVQVTDCYYGSSVTLEFEASYQMTFQHWMSSWTTHFPGLLQQSSISPPRHGDGDPWQAPARYNLNLDAASSVYLIAGLNTGSWRVTWNGDTPVESADAPAVPQVECDFLRDSLAHGRSLGKTVFIYMTHDFNRACSDWELIRQIDVWLYGHKHNQWLSAEPGEVVVQEQRHYPVKLLIGNGGFDEGHIDVVSFGHVTEEVVHKDSMQPRVRLTFRTFDTCVSDQACPSTLIPALPSCWERCKAFPGGFDNGGGPRKAIPSTHNVGFVFEAPQKPPSEPSPAPGDFPKGSWKLRLSQASTSSTGTADAVWLTVARCPSSWFSSATCLVPVSTEATATVFSTYDETVDTDGHVSARLAVDSEVRAPVQVSSAQQLLSMGHLADGSADIGKLTHNLTTMIGLAAAAPPLLTQPAHGFWGVAGEGVGMMRPSGGYPFTFARQPGSWQVLGVGWYSSGLFGGGVVLSLEAHASLIVEFVPPKPDHTVLVV